MRSVDMLFENMARATSQTEAAATAIRERAEGIKTAVGDLSTFRGETERLSLSLGAAANAAQSLAAEDHKLHEEMKPLIAARLAAVSDLVSQAMQEVSHSITATAANAAQSLVAEDRKLHDEMKPLIAARLTAVSDLVAQTMQEVSRAITAEVARAADELRDIGARSRAEEKRTMDAIVDDLRRSAEAAADHRAAITAEAVRFREVQQSAPSETESILTTLARLPAGEAAHKPLENGETAAPAPPPQTVVGGWLRRSWRS
jgi:hypothetical protein